MALAPPSAPLSSAYEPEVYVGDVTAGLGGPPAQEAAPGGGVGFDEATGTMFVNGEQFAAEDHQRALETTVALDNPPVPMPSNFTPLPPESYGEYIRGIRDPSVGRLAAKNFGIGVDVSQQLAGSTLKFLGAEETGQAIVDQQKEDLRFNQPYQRQFTDIESAGDAGMWFVANAAQMAPLMAEMIITSAVTGGAGALAAGATATGAKLLARGAAKKLIPNATSGLQKLRAGKTIKDLSSAERSALRRAGAEFGAKAGAVAAAEGVAIGDIYEAVEESGNFDSPALARLATLIASVPYAAAELAPAAMALKTAVGRSGKSLLTRGSRASRLGKGIAAGSVVEGSTEAFQDMLSLGTSGQLDFNDPAVVNQLVNAFAAGAGLGAPIGGIANSLNKGQATDVLNPQHDSAQPMQGPPEGEPTPTQGEMFEGEDLGYRGPEVVDLPDAQGELFPVTDLGEQDVTSVVDPDQGELFAPQQVSEPVQGELDLDPIPSGTQLALPFELDPMQDELPLEYAEPATNVDPGQLDLEDAITRSRRQEEFELAAAQRDAQEAEGPQTAMALAMQEANQKKTAAMQREAADYEANERALDAYYAQQDTDAAQQQRFDDLEATEMPTKQGFLPHSIRKGVAGSPRKPEPVGPTMLVEHTVEETGEKVMMPVPVDELLEESTTGMKALEALRACLQGVVK